MTTPESKVFGIDLGTTYSAIAHVNELGLAEVLENDEGAQTTPSVVYFEDEDNVVVGMEAKNGQKVFSDETVSLVKRYMGEDRAMEFHGQTHTPESVSALILDYLVRSARDMVDSDSRKVVITVPAYFGLAEKEATKNAGIIAGLDVQGIIAEPVAAALSAGMRPGVNNTVFVYDLGGGTFDCTVMELSEQGIKVLAVDGDRKLGGADWDLKLFDLVLEKFQAAAGLVDNPALDNDFYQDLMANVEDAKKTLTKKQKTKIRCSYEGITEMIEVTREEFEVATRALVEQTLTVSQRALAQAKNREPALSIDKYLLVGGSARMPMVSNALEERFGWELTSSEFDLAVAKGAAMYGQGAMDWVDRNPDQAVQQAASDAPEVKRFYLPGMGSAEGMTIQNILSKSVGCQFYDPELKRLYIGHILHQGQELPAMDTVIATTVEDNTTSLVFRIFEQLGEVPSEDLEANKEISPEGGAVLKNLPNLAKGSPVALVMEIDGEGLITLSGREPESGQDFNLEAQVSALAEKDIKQATAMVAQLTRVD